MGRSLLRAEERIQEFSVAQSCGCSQSCSLVILMVLLSMRLAGNSCLTEDPCPCGQVTAGHMKSLCQIWKSRSEVQSVTVRKSMDKWKVPSESPLVLALLSSHPLSSQLVTLMTNSSPSLPLDTWLLTLEVEAYLSCASPSGTYLVASRESSSHPLTPHPPLPTL